MYIGVMGLGIYVTHFYWLLVEARFYSDIVECLPVDPVNLVRFPAGIGFFFFFALQHRD